MTAHKWEPDKGKVIEFMMRRGEFEVYVCHACGARSVYRNGARRRYILNRVLEDVVPDDCDIERIMDVHES